jgi:hypothetical protein
MRKESQMKFVGKTVQTCAVLAVSLGAVMLGAVRLWAQPASMTLEENMAAGEKKNVVPGKEIHIADMGGKYAFCEVWLANGTTKANSVFNIWNTTGGECPADKVAALEADNGASIKAATGAEMVVINPRRWWAFDEFWVYKVGDKRDFGGVIGYWMGVVPVEAALAATMQGHYHPGQIHRTDTFKYYKGATVYLLDTPDGKVLVQQSYTNHILKDLTFENRKDLGSEFKQLPPGWKFRVKVLDQDLTITPPLPDHMAWVTMDEFLNVYEGCGYDAACNYVP